MKKSLILAVVLSMGLTACSTLQSLVTEPSAFETISALREVLNGSSFKALKTLKKVGDDGVAGILPKEVGGVLNAMKTLGYGKEIEKVSKTIASASGIAAEEGALILKDAISEVDFGDAAAIVIAGEDAATGVLKKAMYGSVKKRYKESLDRELTKSDAMKYWPLAANAYNLFSKDKVDGDLSDFMAERAVDAVFFAMGKEEKAIRKDPKSLGKAVVTKVFDYYQNKKS